MWYPCPCYSRATAHFATINKAVQWVTFFTVSIKKQSIFQMHIWGGKKCMHIYHHYKCTSTYPQLEISDELLDFISVNTVYITVCMWFLQNFVSTKQYVAKCQAQISMRNTNFQDEKKICLQKLFFWSKWLHYTSSLMKFLPKAEFLNVLFLLLDNILTRFNCSIQQQTTYLKKWTDTWLEDERMVEHKGVQQRLRIHGKSGNKAG